MNVGIVGLGLIGGSMARSIKQKAEDRVLGFDIDQETLDMAIMCRAVDAVLDDDSIPSCSLILLAVRPGAAVDWVREKAGLISTDAVVIDLCGIKRKVVSEITPVAEKYGFSYIGGHPMAGKEVNGFENSSADLFSGASMILTPDRHTSLPLLEKLKKFFIGIGFARLTFTTPEDHDRIIAYTSQLAHISSSAY
ncbi:MAG: prephenate dehydrogenase, partial [Oscillospiraceae bacterium]